LPIVLDGGDCDIGIESTIVDFSGDRTRILRPGSISQAQIEAVIGQLENDPGTQAPRVPGLLDKHYAPRTPMRLGTRAEVLAADPRVQVLALRTLPEGHVGIALPADPRGYAHRLYAALRELDARAGTLIVVERPPSTGDWLAVLDRLQRSAAGAGGEERETGLR
jgi:L-threonylcarbamoyladenylate synthase